MSYITQKGIVDENNGTTTPLNNNITFTGTATDVSRYNSVVVAVKTDKSGLLYVDFSPDGTNWDSTLTFSVAANVNEVHRITVTRRYFRLRIFNNSGENQTFLRAQVLLGSQQTLTSSLNSSIQSDADALVVRSVLTGVHDDAVTFGNVPVTSEGHLEVALHDPLLPFGSIHTENLTPGFQGDAVYGLSTEVLPFTGNGGSVVCEDNLFKCQTSTTQYGFGILQTRNRLRYKAGQGMVCRYTALFSGVDDNQYLLAGVGTSETGFYFGYVDGVFGIFYVKGGKREIRTLSITTPSTSVSSYNVTLDNVVYNVSATNNSSTTKTAYEISQGSFGDWSAEAIGSTVVFLARSAGPKNGTFSIAQSGAGVPTAGTFTTTLTGVTSTDVFIPQSEWNGDKLDGTGKSGIVLNPAFGNIYSIHMTYLGFGPIVFKVRICPPNSNNPTDYTAHTIAYPNTSASTNMTQPSFPFGLIAYSTGSTTNGMVATASYAGFIEGETKLNGPRQTYEDVSTAVTTGSYHTLFTVRNSSVYKGRANQSVVRLVSVGGAHDDATPVTLYVIKNATLVGTPNFIQHDVDSCTYVDTDATTCTVSRKSQIILSLPIGQGGNVILPFEDTVLLQPGESVTIAAKAATGTSTYTIATLNTREDQ